MDQAPVTVARGDGIGPEIMDAVLRILAAGGAALDVEEVTLGAQVYADGVPTGVPDAAWESLERTGVLLKGPVMTPQGGGFKSVNVTLRKAFGLFANVRPCLSYAPFVPGAPGVDLVIVRENEEDLYTGVEHRFSVDGVEAVKLATRPGCERIVRYAFEYAARHGRRRVTCVTKDNILKLSDGLFHQVFDEVAAEFPQFEVEHLIVDIGTARVAANPQRFDVVVTPNLYGDIISDVAAEVTGSVGLASSVNVGESCAMFEAIHGSAPDIAGAGVANPSGLLLAAVQLLVHVGQVPVASLVNNAWLCTIEDGVHTADMFDPAVSRRRVGTVGFADAVIERLGSVPSRLPAAAFPAAGPCSASDVDGSDRRVTARSASRPFKELVGVDVTLDAPGAVPSELGVAMAGFGAGLVPLVDVTNRGLQVYPSPSRRAHLGDLWRCRFHAEAALSPEVVQALLARLLTAGVDVVKLEMLFSFDGVPGFSVSQGS
jgi:isocitrate dehydrogenase